MCGASCVHLRLWVKSDKDNIHTACGMSWWGKAYEGKWAYDPKRATCTVCLEEWRDMREAATLAKRNIAIPPSSE